MKNMRCLKLIGFLAVAAGFGAIVMLLWNLLVPAIFGLKTISFWQALGILVLCRLLFGGFGGMRRHGVMGHGMFCGNHNHVHDKWMKMTPEQRKEFFDKRREHFHGCGFFGRRRFDFDHDETSSEKQ